MTTWNDCRAVISEAASRELDDAPEAVARYSDVRRPGPFGRDQDRVRGPERGYVSPRHPQPEGARNEE